MNKEMAVLMAAGMGTRMLPLTERVPKPLVKVGGTPMIETVIAGLLRRGIREIYVVTGHLGACFQELEARHPEVRLVPNREYAEKNNISSIHAVLDVLGRADCFICEADLFVADPSVFDADLERSCYFARQVPGWSGDWVFDVDASGRITRVGKGGRDAWNMVGVAYFKAADAARLARAVAEAYGHEGHGGLFWDEVVDANLGELDLAVHPVRDGQITEIDTIAELAEADPRWAAGNGVDERTMVWI